MPKRLTLFLQTDDRLVQFVDRRIPERILYPNQVSVSFTTGIHTFPKEGDLPHEGSVEPGRSGSRATSRPCYSPSILERYHYIDVATVAASFPAERLVSWHRAAKKKETIKRISFVSSQIRYYMKWIRIRIDVLVPESERRPRRSSPSEPHPL
jgi:hypothetical protein